MALLRQFYVSLRRLGDLFRMGMSLRYGDDINSFGSDRVFERNAGAAVSVACSTKANGRAYVGLLIGLSITVLIMVLGQWTWPNHTELKLFDQRMRLFNPAVNSDDHVVIAIDDNSLEQRSEEHTSELQSHSFISYAVFCLKKKTKI